jgi:putative transposase
MTIDKNRKSLRLPHYDYATPGAYFLTICVADRACLLGSVTDGKVVLSRGGRIVEETWRTLPSHYPHIELDEFVVMPNHMHGLLVIREDGSHPLPELVRAFKSFSAREINKAPTGSRRPLWQRGYHEHVVRGEKDLNAIRGYIQNNPLQWEMDEENPARRR